MGKTNITVTKADSSTALQKPVRKSRSKGQFGKNKHKVKEGQDGQNPSILKSAWVFLSGLYANSSQDESKRSGTLDQINQIVDGEPNFGPTDPRSKTQDETFADVVTGRSSENQGDSFKPEVEEPEVVATIVVNRPPRPKGKTGPLPRQNSSGMNAILLDDPNRLDNKSEEPEVHTSTSPQIRSSYDKPKRGDPPPPLRLTNIFNNRIQNCYSPDGKGCESGILNRAFFESVNHEIREIKSKAATNVPTTIVAPFDDVDYENYKKRPKNQDNSLNRHCSFKEIPDKTPERSGHSRSKSSTVKKESNGSVNINLTVQLGQVDGQHAMADLGDISIASSNRTVIIDGRIPPAKLDMQIQTEPEAETQKRLSPPGMDLEDFVVDNLGQALNYTSSSLMSAASIITGFIPGEATILNQEDMNAKEGDLAITLMRMMGVPQELRHKIYLELCDEVEVLQDITTGTFEALDTVLKWAIGGPKGRQDLIRKTRALCAVTSEVDMDSEVWYRLQEEVAEITNTVESAINEGLEDAKSVPRLCSEAFVDFVSTATSAATFYDPEIEPTSGSQHVMVKKSLSDVKNNNPVYGDQLDEEVGLNIFEGEPHVKKAEDKNGQDIHPDWSNASVNRPHYWNDPEASFLYCPNAFREQLQKPGCTFGPSEASLRKARSGRFEEEDESFKEMRRGRTSDQRSLGDNDNGFTSQNAQNMPQAPEMQTVGRAEILTDFVGVMRRLSKSFLPHFMAPTKEPDLNNNQVEDLESKPSECTTRCPSGTSSVQVPSNPSLNQLPRVPTNSESIIDMIKHDEKVLKDLARLQELVQELYDEMTPPTSQTDLNIVSETPSQSSEKCDEEEEELESIQVPSLTVSNNNSDTTTVSSAATEPRQTKPVTGSRIPIPSSARQGPISHVPRYSRSSTVSLYQSQRSSIAQKSVLEMDNPMVRNVPIAVQRSIQRLGSSISTVSSSTGTTGSERSNRTSTLGRPRRDFVRENKSIVPSSTRSTLSSSRVTSGTSLATSNNSILSSRTSQSTALSNLSAETEPKRVAVPIIYKTILKKPPVPSKPASSVVSSSGNTGSSRRRSLSRPPPPKSYQQIQDQRKEYKANAQEYLQSVSSGRSRNSSVSKYSSRH